MGLLPKLLRNRKRLHHFQDEITRGLPLARWSGPCWDPDNVWVVVRDPSCVRHILKDGFHKVTKPDPQKDWLFGLFAKFVGTGVFTLQHGCGAPDGGALWVQQRKIAANIFTRGNFNSNMGEVFLAKAKHLRDCLKAGEATDMQRQFFNFTMDSILKIFFNEDSDTMAGETNKFGSAFDEAHRSFFEYWMLTLPLVSVTKFLPWPFGGTGGLCMRLHGQCSPLYRRFMSSISELDSESRRIINKCRADPRLSDRKDLLALFMQAVEQEGLPASRSTRYLRDVVLNFIIAGRDTTACTLSWMFYLLGTHPEIQQRVQEEVDRCVPSGTNPTLKLLHHSNMPLLHALLYETMRLYPAVPQDVKEAAEDVALPNGCTLPKGTKLIYIPWAMGRDPEVYPEPMEVRLERWIPFKQPTPHEFPVFQAGPRICLGMDMAIFEAKLVTCMLLQEFSFTLASGEDSKIHYSHMLTMSVCNSKEQDSHNLWLVPHRRRAASDAHPSSNPETSPLRHMRSAKE
jgi:cytochrome P450